MWLAQPPSRWDGQPDRPLFIGACPRSGTTLLRSLLNNHPDLAVPAETDFVLPVWTNRGRLGNLAVEANRRRLAEWLMDTPGRGGKRIRARAFTRDEAIARVLAAPGTLGSVFAALFALFADAKGRRAGVTSGRPTPPTSTRCSRCFPTRSSSTWCAIRGARRSR